MSKCIVVSDSFKGTLSSTEICTIAKEVMAEVLPAWQVVTVPVADGGEGTAECFARALEGELVTVPVCGPLGGTVEAVYARKGTLAVIEMAAAAGLPLVGAHRDVEAATTYGVGELMRHAVENGAKELILGLGGSATNDGGCGCAAALGGVFRRASGESFLPTGGTLGEIADVDLSPVQELLQNVKITAMCDVDNPLCGGRGAAAVFAPQKGADAACVARLDAGLAHLAQVWKDCLGADVAQLPGAGAAGGMGAGCVAFFGAELKSGIETVLDTVGFDDLAEGAELVITGEGQLDEQSLHGKVISGVARRTAKRNIPLLVLAGSVEEAAVPGAYALGVSAVCSINRRAEDFSVSAPRSAENYRAALRDLLRLIRSVRR